MITLQEVIQIGILRKPHATRGEIVCELQNDCFDFADPDYLILELDHILVPFFIEEYRFTTGDTVLVKFCDIDTAEQALRLTGAKVYLHQRQLPQDIELQQSAGSFVGYQVVEREKGLLGRVVEVDTSTVNTLLVLDNGLLLPFHEDLVQAVDADLRQITMSVPEGLLHLSDLSDII